MKKNYIHKIIFVIILSCFFVREFSGWKKFSGNFQYSLYDMLDSIFRNPVKSTCGLWLLHRRINLEFQKNKHQQYQREFKNTKELYKKLINEYEELSLKAHNIKLQLGKKSTELNVIKDDTVYQEKRTKIQNLEKKIDELHNRYLVKLENEFKEFREQLKSRDFFIHKLNEVYKASLFEKYNHYNPYAENYYEILNNQYEYIFHFFSTKQNSLKDLQESFEKIEKEANDIIIA